MRYSLAAEAVQGGYMPEQTALTNLLKEDELYRLQLLVARYAISDGAMKTALPILRVAKTWD
jgi:hypothetical protein